MVRTVNIVLDDADFERIKKVKRSMTWEKYIIMCTDLIEARLRHG